MPRRPRRNYTWSWRRSAIFGTISFCAFWMSWILVKGIDSQLYRDAFSSLSLLLMSTVGSYVFGAVWDATDMRRNGVPAYGDPSPESAVQPVEEVR